MREIKFRVFIDRKFYYWGFINNQFIGLPIVSNLGQKEVMGRSQQFTGLLDRHGKEIYEGDIIAFEETVMSDVGEDKSNYIEKRIVENFKYADGKVGKRMFGREIKIVNWENKSCGFEPFSDSDGNCGHCGGGERAGACEVIGNIYENPELLK